LSPNSSRLRSDPPDAFRACVTAVASSDLVGFEVDAAEHEQRAKAMQ
jgi:hypothetical protein